MPRVSDDAVAQKTGRTWAEWFKLLDKARALDWTHAERAAWLEREKRLDGWWAQSVTVEYERERGLRAVGQRLGGHHEASVQRTLDAPPGVVERALREAAGALDVALAVEPRASDTSVGRVLRFGGEERVELTLSPKEGGRCVVRVVQGGLPDGDAREAAKARWVAVVEDLRARLGQA